MTHNGHSDDRYLGFTFEPEKAIRILTDLRDLGYDHVSIRQMLAFALSKIEHRQEKLEKMKHLLEVRESISVSGLATSLGVTRQTIYAIENDKFIPSTELALKMSAYFGKTVNELFSL